MTSHGIARILNGLEDDDNGLSILIPISQVGLRIIPPNGWTRDREKLSRYELVYVKHHKTNRLLHP